MRESSASVNVVSWHQHGVSKLPHVAGAQPFGPPHSGQMRFGAGMAGNAEMVEWVTIKAQMPGRGGAAAHTLHPERVAVRIARCADAHGRVFPAHTCMFMISE